MRAQKLRLNPFGFGMIFSAPLSDTKFKANPALLLRRRVLTEGSVDEDAVRHQGMK